MSGFTDIRIESDPEVARHLLQASDDLMSALYPAESNHMLDLESLRGDAVEFLVAEQERSIAGCGALVRMNGYGEIKRMFVDPAMRGRRIGKRLLMALEVVAEEKRIGLLRLETGIHQPEAIALYEGAGFKRIAPFGDYENDPLSIFMEKQLL